LRYGKAMNRTDGDSSRASNDCELLRVDAD
jgi:hypothetical protein